MCNFFLEDPCENYMVLVPNPSFHFHENPICNYIKFCLKLMLIIITTAEKGVGIFQETKINLLIDLIISLLHIRTKGNSRDLYISIGVADIHVGYI